MSALRLLRAEVPQAAVDITCNRALSAETTQLRTSGKWNLVSRNRWNTCFTAGAETSVEFIFSLPNGRTDIIDTVCLTRADLIADRAFNTVTLLRATTFAGTYTTEQTFDLSTTTRVGPRIADALFRFTETLAFQFWKLKFARSSGAIGFGLTPVFMGKAFVPTQHPSSWDVRLIDEAEGDDQTIAGTQIATRIADKFYRAVVTWDGLTDTEVETLSTDFFQRAGAETFVIFTDTNHGILNDVRQMHVEIVDARVELIHTNWNRVQIEFREVLG